MRGVAEEEAVGTDKDVQIARHSAREPTQEEFESGIQALEEIMTTCVSCFFCSCCLCFLFGINGRASSSFTATLQTYGIHGPWSFMVILLFFIQSHLYPSCHGHRCAL